MSKRFNPWKKFSGAWLPDWLIQRTEISSNAKIVYSLLAKHSGPKGTCFPSRTRIASKSGLTIYQVDRATRELKDKALIESRQRGLGKSSEYYFLEHEWMTPAFAYLQNKDSHVCRT